MAITITGDLHHDTFCMTKSNERIERVGAFRSGPLLVSVVRVIWFIQTTTALAFSRGDALSACGKERQKFVCPSQQYLSAIVVVTWLSGPDSERKSPWCWSSNLYYDYMVRFGQAQTSLSSPIFTIERRPMVSKLKECQRWNPPKMGLTEMQRTQLHIISFGVFLHSKGHT